MATQTVTEQGPTAEQTVSLKQLEWILCEIATEARGAILLDRHQDLSAPEDMEALIEADFAKRRLIARLGWLADVGLTRMGSSLRVHDGDPFAWLVSSVTAEALGN